MNQMKTIQKNNFVPLRKKLKFKRITFESLLAACHVGFKGVSKENWTKPMLQSYLKTEGLNTSIIKMIYDSGFLQKTYIAIDNHTSNLTKEKIKKSSKGTETIHLGVFFTFLIFH